MEESWLQLHPEPFGSGAEFSDFVDLNKLGAVTTKGVANVPWAGNATPSSRGLRWNDECDRSAKSGNRIVL